VLSSGCSEPPQSEGLDVATALGGVPEAGFARADRPRTFHFPEDHRAHPDYRNEWWYLTGNLENAAGERFGYQLTFFRIALSPQAPRSDSAWATQQVWMAHVAVSDGTRSEHRHSERLARGAAGLAGQADEPFRVWLEDWQLLGGPDAAFPWRIRVEDPELALNLEVTPLKAPVLQGDAGLSQKSSAAGNASYYYSISRLQTYGQLRVGEHSHTVSGLSWLDREWSTSALGEDQQGWDWFSLQLEDGRELMLYRLRLRDGSADPLSSAKWIAADGSSRSLSSAQFQLEPLRHWEASDGRRYPVAWRLQAGPEEPPLRIEALFDAQQMRTGVVYWEGAVTVHAQDEDALLGRGYLEMTGY
jgi:predicted secreted hydrolase